MLERACRHFLPNVFCSSAGIALPFQDENSFIFRRRLVSGGCSDPVLHSIRPILGALITHRLASARRIRTFRFTPFPVSRFYLSCSSHPLYTALHASVGPFKLSWIFILTARHYLFSAP